MTDFANVIQMPTEIPDFPGYLWSALNDAHFGGTLPAVAVVWDAGLAAPARIEPGALAIDVDRLPSNQAEQVRHVVGVLLHTAVTIKTAQLGHEPHGQAWRGLANGIAARMGWRQVRTKQQAQRWPMGVSVQRKRKLQGAA